MKRENKRGLHCLLLTLPFNSATTIAIITCVLYFPENAKFDFKGEYFCLRPNLTVIGKERLI